MPSTPGTGILFPSRRKQENQPQMALFATPGAPDDPSQEPARPAKTLVSTPVQKLGSTSILTIEGEFQRDLPIQARGNWSDFLEMTPGVNA